MKKGYSVASLCATFFLASAIILTDLDPEEPNFIGKTFFSAVFSLVSFPPSNITAYGDYLYNKYTTDMHDIVPNRFDYYYGLDINNASRSQIYSALLKGPQKPIEPFVEEALITYATLFDCGGPLSKKELEDCIIVLARMGLLKLDRDIPIAQKSELERLKFLTELSKAQTIATMEKIERDREEAKNFPPPNIFEALPK